jgi:hypothetical protein
LKNFIEKLLSLLSVWKRTENDSARFDFVKTRKGILKELVISKQSKNIIGVCADVLGEGLFLTTVADIVHTPHGREILFDKYQVIGRPLPITRVQLDEIIMVCAFSAIYKKPLSTEMQSQDFSREYNGALTSLEYQHANNRIISTTR